MIFDGVLFRMNPRTLAMLMVKYFKQSTKIMIGEIEGNQFLLFSSQTGNFQSVFVGALFQPEARGHDPV